MGLDRRHHRSSSGSDSLQSTNSFTSFINVINLIFLLGEVSSFFNSSYMYLLPSLLVNFLTNYAASGLFIFNKSHDIFTVFFIKILYQIYLNKHLFQILQISAFVFLKFYRSPVNKSSAQYTVLVPGILCVVFRLVNQNK